MPSKQKTEFIYVFPGGSIRTDPTIRGDLLPLLETGRVRILQTNVPSLNGQTGMLHPNGTITGLPQFVAARLVEEEAITP